MKAFIGYLSMSGNTEDMASILKKVLESKGCEVYMDSLDLTDIHSILAYDCIFIGAYTWGDGDLPYEAEDFFEELNDHDLTGIHAACFGSGDHAYPKFCAAVDTLADKLSERGANVFQQRLKIELNPETDEQILECQQFAESAYEWIVKNEEMEHV
ncbi:flavodoxin [Cytobacillus oceanisediminis]|uniref:flavodoxin n=1 Tax=Cytobacillus TaxID=2675230 RepID=UPI00203F106E|nr:flavodoxin [Cytobacillus oceanisediminis]MBY0156479.1 flavodoxin [Cytobacillus firmus]MCM3530655.1 flavodoxin [Cytobacillus oceanisediminis]